MERYGSALKLFLPQLQRVGTKCLLQPLEKDNLMLKKLACLLTGNVCRALGKPEMLLNELLSSLNSYVLVCLWLSLSGIIRNGKCKIISGETIENLLSLLKKRGLNDMISGGILGCIMRISYERGSDNDYLQMFIHGCSDTILSCALCSTLSFGEENETLDEGLWSMMKAILKRQTVNILLIQNYILGCLF